MKENITILFFILILVFAGFGVYYYYKNIYVGNGNSSGVVSTVFSYNSIGFQILGSKDGENYLATQVGGKYKIINITVYVTLDGYEGYEPVRVELAGPKGSILIFTSDYKYNFTIGYYSKIVDNVYKTSKIQISNVISVFSDSWLVGDLQNNSVINFTVLLIKVPRIRIHTSDAAGNPVILENNYLNSSLCDLPSITLTLQWSYRTYPTFERWFTLLGVSTQGSGWCNAA